MPVSMLLNSANGLLNGVTNTLLRGSSGDDDISLNNEQNLASGEGGNDSITGSASDDVIYGGHAEGADVGNDAHPLTLNINNLHSQSYTGTEASAGDWAIYENVAELADGRMISGRLVLVEKSDPWMSVDLASGRGYEILMQGWGTGDTAKFRLEFFDPATGDPIALNSIATFNDIDRNSGDDHEGVHLDSGSFTEVGVADDSNLNVSQSGSTVSAIGSTSNNPDDEEAWFSARFEDRTFIEFDLESRTSKSGFTLSGAVISDVIFTEIEEDNDTLSGGLGDDIIFGQGGDDLLDGGEGNDSLSGGSGDDLLTGDIGNDTLLGGSGADTIFGGDGDDYIEGGEGDDLLRTGLGNDTLLGGEGNDTLMNSAGDDSLVGGTGDDSIVATEGNDTLIGGEGNDTMFGGADNDSLIGGTGHDVMYGEDGNDALQGDEGDDTMQGGTGLDTMDGGAGADVMWGGADNDVMTAGTGNDTLHGGSGNDSVEGGDDNDLIYGDAGDDTLAGGAGDDLLYGGAGNDYMTTGTGNDTLYGGEGDDTLQNSSGDDSLVGGTGNDSITATEGNDTLEGGTGNDTMHGGADDDMLYGGEGDDSMTGGDDSDTFVIEDNFGRDTIEGGEGGVDYDTLDLSGVSDPVDVTFTGDETGTVTSGTNGIRFSEIEHVEGTSGDDTFDGSLATTGFSVDAGAGDDTITTGQGSDTIAGGAGDDTFVLTSGGGSDRITDYDTADDDGDGLNNDQFDVSNLQGGSGYMGKVTWRDVTVSDDGHGNAKLTFPEGETVILKGVAPASMTGEAQLRAAGIPCFTSGTLIQTLGGQVPVENLRPGDLVNTFDNGPQPIQWVASRALAQAELAAEPALRPICIEAGTFGQSDPLIVSPQHGLLLSNGDGPRKLVRAKHLADLRGGTIRVMNGCRAVRYHHLLFGTHQVIWANNLPAESFYPGPMALAGLTPQARCTLFARFPAIARIAAGLPPQEIYGAPAAPYSRTNQLPEHIDAFHLPRLATVA